MAAWAPTARTTSTSLASSAIRASAPSSSCKPPRLRHRPHPRGEAAVVGARKPRLLRGGGGGSAASPTHHEHNAKPHAKPLHVDVPAAPRASSPMDGGTTVASAPGSASTEAVRALAFAGDAASPGGQPGGQRLGWPAGRVRRRTGTRPVRDRPGFAARFRPLADGRDATDRAQTIRLDCRRCR